MEVEFTARQVKITRALRTQAAEGLERIGRLLGKTARASITFGAQRHLQLVEITVQVRLQTIAAAGKADTLDAALHEAIDHAMNQARRYRDKRLERKRLPKEEKVLTALPVARPKARAAEPPLEEADAKPARKARASIAVHSYPNLATVVALLSRQRGGPSLTFQLLVYPVVDFTGSLLTNAALRISFARSFNLPLRNLVWKRTANAQRCGRSNRSTTFADCTVRPISSRFNTLRMSMKKGTQ